MNSHEVFIHIHQGCFAGTGAIVRLPQCERSKPDGYGKISQCRTTAKHSKAKTVCIFLGIYCRSLSLTKWKRFSLFLLLFANIRLLIFQWCSFTYTFHGQNVEIDTCAFQTGISCPVQPRACHWNCVFFFFFTQFEWHEANVLDNRQLAELPQSGGREFDPRRVHDNLSVPYRFLCGCICVSLCQSIKK